MAKVLENPIVTSIFRHKRFVQPETTINLCECGNGKTVKYEVYETRQKHCFDCLMEAIETMDLVQVRRIDNDNSYGGWDDAS